MNCIKCNGKVENFVWIGEKKKIISNHRKYCISCSPFDEHNTRKLERQKIEKAIYPERTCPICGKKHNKRGFVCQVCSFNLKEEKAYNKVKELVGRKCWICGYDKSKRSLCFHHVHPENKNFGLTIREISNFSWEKVKNEIQKCIFICNNCHGEIHDNLIDKNTIEKLWNDFWIKIRACSSIG